MNMNEERETLIEALRRAGIEVGYVGGDNARRVYAERLMPWLAEHDRRVRAEALREAAEEIQALHPGETKNSVIWLRERADRIEGER